MLHAAFEAVIREERTSICASLIRMTSDWELAEDCVQEACLRAWDLWSREGLPARPGGWLATVAKRLALDHLRRARRQCPIPDELVGGNQPDDSVLSPAGVTGVEDDVLRLIFSCCHPALSEPSQVALTLRTVCGLTTREIARAFVEAEPTTAQRLVRARRKLAEESVPFELPSPSELPLRLVAVQAVVYLVFTEGYAASAGPALLRPDLSHEAIRLARLLVRLLPDDPETSGLLALMLLHDARGNSRVDRHGNFVLLADQDRSLWDRGRIDEGVRILDKALVASKGGPYQTQAAIAALHATAPSAADTDWGQITGLYGAMLRRSPNPVLELNAAVAMAMAGDVDEALDWIASLERRNVLKGYYLLPAAKADLLRRCGRNSDAYVAYADALSIAPTEAERRYLRG
ncbi:MAG: sigma-70 family RNA polymerase sigma factor, partial [Bryobacteraceae bacterium]|nr:sigma-70 family RNA polymerase sigma factor [Bryobacteraceae bacterium]